MSLSSHFAEQDGDFARHSNDFMEWLKRSPGVRVSAKIRIADLRSENAGRGVVACQNIGEDEELFAIPLNLVLSVKNSKANDLLGLDNQDLGPWLSLMIAMIYEFLRGGASQWAPYFRVLPTQFDTLMFWTEDELRELQGSAILEKIGKADADAMIIDRVVPLIIQHSNLFLLPDGLSSFDSPEGKSFLLRLAHRMGSLIMAYAFDIGKSEDEDTEDEGEDGYVTDDEEQLPKGMVPLADTLNADADRNNARLFQEDDCFIMKSIKPISAGEQIFNDYGELPRADLLRRYGYVTDNYAPYDVVEISLEKLCAFAGMKSVEPGPETPQLEFLDDAGLLEDGYSLSRITKDTPLSQAMPKEFVTVFRALRMSPNELATLRANNKLPKGALTSSEARLLSKLLRQRLADYPTSIEDDTKLLAGQLSTNASRRRQKMAIQVRQGEKEILLQHIEALETYASQCPPERENKRTNYETSKGKNAKRRMA
ncbi:hypothetical protein VTO42DRAFT_3589 [Malbranchea cinnamomea]